MSYAVLLKELVPLDPESVAQVLRTVPGWTLFDAKRQVRRCRGILCEGIPEEVAQRIAASLESMGIPVFLMETERMGALPNPFRIHNADCLDEHLVLTRPNGAEETVPWESVLCISAGTIRTARLRKEYRAGPRRYSGLPGHAPVDTSEIAYRKTEEQADLCDVITARPAGRFRFNRRELNYDYLAGRLRRDSRTNFSTFVGDLLRHAPRAMNNEGARICAAGERSLPLYDDMRDFDEEQRWRLNRAAVGIAPGREAP